MGSEQQVARTSPHSSAGCCRHPGKGLQSAGGEQTDAAASSRSGTAQGADPAGQDAKHLLLPAPGADFFLTPHYRHLVPALGIKPFAVLQHTAGTPSVFLHKVSSFDVLHSPTQKQQHQSSSSSGGDFSNPETVALALKEPLRSGTFARTGLLQQRCSWCPSRLLLPSGVRRALGTTLLFTCKMQAPAQAPRCMLVPRHCLKTDSKEQKAFEHQAQPKAGHLGFFLVHTEKRKTTPKTHLLSPSEQTCWCGGDPVHFTADSGWGFLEGSDGSWASCYLSFTTEPHK